MDLTPLLAPRSVAVVGASERPDSYGGNVLANLRRAGYGGSVHGVNPGRESAHGYPCVSSLADLPEPADAVVVAIPAPGVTAVIAEAAELGCGGAVVVSAGFAESKAGLELQSELRETALAARLPVCGPNGNGVISAHARAPLWGDSAPPLEPGPVALISQSGNVAVNALGSRRGLRFHTVVSSGNQAVLDASDWLAALARADGVRSVALFLESDGDGARLAEALAECTDAGVAVAVLKVGSSEAGAKAAAAHTASLAGDQRVFRALIEEAGAAWAADPHELLELAKALAEPAARPSGSGGLAVLTCSGGDSGVAADQAERLGIPLPALAPATAGALEALLPEAATVANPLDYTAMIWGDVERLGAIIEAVGSDAAIDQLLVLYDHPEGLSAEADRTWGAVREGILSGAARTDAAVLVCSTLPDLIDDAATAELGAHGVVGLAGLGTGLACAKALRGAPADPERLRAIAAATLSARAASAQDGPLDEHDAKLLLAEAGVAVPRGRVAGDAADAVAAWRELGAQVALKAVRPGLLHKSDSGASGAGARRRDRDRGGLRPALLVRTRGPGAGRGDGQRRGGAARRLSRRRRGPGARDRDRRNLGRGDRRRRDRPDARRRRPRRASDPLASRRAAADGRAGEEPAGRSRHRRAGRPGLRARGREGPVAARAEPRDHRARGGRGGRRGREIRPGMRVSR